MFLNIMMQNICCDMIDEQKCSYILSTVYRIHGYVYIYIYISTVYSMVYRLWQKFVHMSVLSYYRIADRCSMANEYSAVICRLLFTTTTHLHHSYCFVYFFSLHFERPELRVKDTKNPVVVGIFEQNVNKRM